MRMICLLLSGLVLLGLSGCGGPAPVELVRQFHIATIMEDAEALEKIDDPGAVTKASTDFRLMRDTLFFFAKSQPIRERPGATKLIDGVCKFGIDPDYTGEGTQVLALADFSQVLVPFLGDAAKGVPGKPKDVLKYSFLVEKIEGRNRITRVTLPIDQLRVMGERFKIDLQSMERDVDDPEAKPADGPT